MKSSCITIVVFSIVCCRISAAPKDSIMDRFKSGIQMAGKIFGMDPAMGVAELVSNAFTKRSEENESDEPNGMFTAVLKMLSLDVSKIGAVVVNAIIFLAQLISTTLVPKNPALPESEFTPRQIRGGSPIEWVLEKQKNSEHFKKLLEAAKDENLTVKVIEAIQGESEKEDTQCVQLLICRITPFVRGMQRALLIRDQDQQTEQTNRGRNSVLFRYLPEFEEFNRYGNECKRRHEECRLLD